MPSFPPDSTTETLRRFHEASSVLASVRDVIAERVRSTGTPSWCDRRGWTPFLEALGDEQVFAIEREGLATYLAKFPDAPGDLVTLARAVVELTTLPVATMALFHDVDPHRTSPRKRAQVAAFASLAEQLPRMPSRIVDVGSGHGHLTRHLARAMGVEAEGWESDPARVAVASSLTDHDGPRFVTIDARAASNTLSSSDLVVGLHACGELSDIAVRAAAANGASIAIIGCCLQKRDGDRAPLVTAPGLSFEALTIGRAVLGLGNAGDGEDGVEADLATRTRSRVNRNALRSLLNQSGLDLRSGAEMHGVNRRRATGTLTDLVYRAFTARGLSPPSPAAIANADRCARDDYARTSRWTLPRTMLARLIEVWVALDRVAFLAANGYDARAVIAFDAATSPRNVAVIGYRR